MSLARDSRDSGLYEREIAAQGYTNCKLCGEKLPTMDHVVDHLGDVHQAYDLVTDGRLIIDDAGGQS
jgi:hypothetical protein